MNDECRSTNDERALSRPSAPRFGFRHSDFVILVCALLIVDSVAAAQPGTQHPALSTPRVRLITIDPGHYHASLVQIRM